MTTYKELALRHTYTCFFNSLLREIDFYQVNPNDIKMNLPGQELIIGLKKASLVGRHEYSGEFYHVVNNIKTSVSFFAVIDILLPFLFKNNQKDNSDLADIFKKRLENSLRNMELSLEMRKEDIARIYQDDLLFHEAEQALFIGHNFHPYPKMREGFNDEDYRHFSPEMGGAFRLLWVALKPENLLQFQASRFEDLAWTTTLAEHEKVTTPDGMIPLPMHPWQFKTLKNKNRLQDIPMEILGEGAHLWYPTSSLRSLYSPDAPYMLKFSLTLKLTNSIRHLTDVEVVRGMQVYDVLSSTKGQEFKAKHPEFEIIAEPAYIGIRDLQGQLLHDTLVVARSNPFKSDEVNNVVVSTLAQDNPLGNENLINNHIAKYSEQNQVSLAEASMKWFKEYLRVAVLPLIDGQANFGFLLGAHQQNLIVHIQNHLPAKGYFRDCQGTGYNQSGYDFYRQEVPSMTVENGNILGEMGNILFAYYLIINSTFNVIAAIAQNNQMTELRLLEELQKTLVDFRNTRPLDSTFLNYVLDKQTLLQKGNFFCSLENINENTSANPLSLYNSIPNPLYLGGTHVSV